VREERFPPGNSSSTLRNFHVHVVFPTAGHHHRRKSSEDEGAIHVRLRCHHRWTLANPRGISLHLATQDFFYRRRVNWDLEQTCEMWEIEPWWGGGGSWSTTLARSPGLGFISKATTSSLHFPYWVSRPPSFFSFLYFHGLGLFWGFFTVFGFVFFSACKYDLAR